MLQNSDEGDHVSACSDIQNTLYRLAWGADRRDVDSLEAGFTEDVTWIRELSPEHVEVVEGRDAIIARMKEVWAKTPAPNSKHMITNVLVQSETDQEAEVTSYKTVIRVVDGKPTVGSTGWYRDFLVNESGTWRVRKRVIVQDA
jgi:SnoaL-like domain